MPIRSLADEEKRECVLTHCEFNRRSRSLIDSASQEAQRSPRNRLVDS